MKAVILKENGVLTLSDVDKPSLSSGECLIELARSGVCSSDIARSYYGGAYSYPLIMGHELAGTVADIGNDIQNFACGDRVAVFPLLPCRDCPACHIEKYAQCHNYNYYGSRRNGGFAEKLGVEAWNLTKIPTEVCFDNAALIEPTAVVVHALDKLLSKDKPSEVLIIGAGFLGLVAIDIIGLIDPNIKVVIVDRNTYKLEIAALSGAETFQVINEENWGRFIASRPDGYPYVLEATGNPEGFRNALNLCSRSGRVCWMGNISDSLELSQKEVSDVLRRELTILGTWNSIYKGNDHSDWTKTIDMMQQGLFPARYVSHRTALSDLPFHLAELSCSVKRRRGKYIKVLVENS